MTFKSSGQSFRYHLVVYANVLYRSYASLIINLFERLFFQNEVVLSDLLINKHDGACSILDLVTGY